MVLRHGVPVVIYTFVEVASSALFLLVALPLIKTPLPHLVRHWKVGVVGLLNPAATYFLINIGLARTSVTHAALIQTIEPVLIAALSWLLFRHVVPRRVLIPMITVLAGSALVVTAASGQGTASPLGDLFVALGILTAASFAVASSRIDDELPAASVTLLQMLYALMVIAPITFGVLWSSGGHLASEHGTWTVGSAPLLTWVIAPIIGIASTAVAFWLYITGLRKLPPATAAQFLAIIPVVSFLGAIVVLGEPATLRGVLGVAIVVVSLIFIARGEQQADQAYRATHPPPNDSGAGSAPHLDTAARQDHRCDEDPEAPVGG